MNIGAIGSMLEWNRRLTIDLTKQLFFDLVEGVFLKLTVDDIIGIIRGEGETEADYKQRVGDIILGYKISPAAIIYNSRPYSTSEPVLLEGDLEGAYAGYSYAGIYEDFQLESPPENLDEWVFPAITTKASTSAYFFILRLENTESSAIPLLVDKINRLIAAGIDYDIRIEYT